MNVICIDACDSVSWFPLIKWSCFYKTVCLPHRINLEINLVSGFKKKKNLINSEEHTC